MENFILHPFNYTSTPHYTQNIYFTTLYSKYIFYRCYQTPFFSKTKTKNEQHANFNKVFWNTANCFITHKEKFVLKNST